MSSKVYAVKKGRHPGIYNSWDDCKKQVNGYSGAEFKSFKSLEDAEEYLGINSVMTGEVEPDMSVITENDTAVAYVDGSYNVKTGIYGCGVVIFSNGSSHQYSHAFCDELASMRNVAGEIAGAAYAMDYCVHSCIKNLKIYYDYEGIEKWCTGEWMANKEGTRAYKKLYNEASKTVKISFHKVKGHSGDKYNDLADSLAKQAVGI